MSGRAPNGDGWISPKPINGYYRGHVTVDGQRVHRRGKTKAIVRAKLRQAVEDRKSGKMKQTATSRKLSDKSTEVGEYLDWWVSGLPSRVVAGTLAPGTLETYQRNVRLHLRPALVGVMLVDLDRQRIRELQAQLFAKPRGNRKPTNGPAGTLGRSTAAQAMRVLHTALQQAVDDGLLVENPCDGVRKPRRDDVERPPALSADQAAELLRKASKTSLPAGPARVACSTILGLRQAEVIGLFETDLNSDCSELVVRKKLTRPAWQHGSNCSCNQDPDAGVVVTGGHCPSRVRAPIIGPTKTAAGRRSVPVPPALQPLFRAHLDLLHARREALGDLWPEGPAWLFPGDLGQQPQIRSDSQRWSRMVHRILGPNAPTGTHAGRRHAVTRLAEAGVPIHTAMEIMGWSARELMEVYARVSSDHKRNEMARAWDDLRLS